MSKGIKKSKTGLRRLLPVFAVGIFLIGLYLFFFAPSDARGVVVQVLDGQTIELADRDGNRVIRLYGVVVPPTTTPEADGASDLLREIASGREAVCQLKGDRDAKAQSAVCYVENKDLGEALVELGFARDCPGLSAGSYQTAEQKAADAGSTIRRSLPLPQHCQPKPEKRDK